MTDWSDLGRELDLWRALGTPATFWWRDDDATCDSEPLSCMLEIADRFSAPLSLAVIPALVKPDLSDVVNRLPDVSVLQHGYSHTNYASPSEKKMELGLHRNTDEVISELRAGFICLENFSARLPVLVPPWNRIESTILSQLRDIGYKGVSTMNSRETTYAAPGLIRINAHVDIVDWHGSRGFIGLSGALDQFIKHLSERRMGLVSSDEPTGLLTHHLVHDRDCWKFLESLLTFLMQNNAGRLVSISEAMTA